MDRIFSDFVVYVDESGDATLDKINPNFPVFVLTFCVFKKSSYTHDVIPQMSELKFRTFGHDMVVLHEREIRKQLGFFAGMNHPDVFLAELTDIINDTDVTLISIVIKKQSFLEQASHSFEPYALALQYGLEKIYEFVQIHHEQGKLLHVIFESRGKKEDKELAQNFHKVCNGCNKNQEIYPFEPVFASKLVNSNGLQLADLTARPIGLYAMRPNQPNRTYSILEKKLWKGVAGRTIIGNGLKIFP